ncbi:hypothetical protein [Azospirillum soli]|uniref:hypothetical protein n=1 Tax=Azospirillum soli TaxID=1304799 RepID=UPI001AE1BB61|nr:hypothetical protein [Azospirillum soli]MBP2315462.1 hypothetical protein [Azospirillum soli]
MNVVTNTAAGIVLKGKITQLIIAPLRVCFVKTLQRLSDDGLVIRNIKQETNFDNDAVIVGDEHILEYVLHLAMCPEIWSITTQRQIGLIDSGAVAFMGVLCLAAALDWLKH